LIERGVKEENIIFVNLLSTPNGLEQVSQAFPKITLVAASVEDGLDENKFLLPGIGDFGKRYFGTEN
jgi:uracil phosphoribosyltransferase